MLAQLTSLPGIGKRTAMLLTALTDGFTRFEISKRLVGYMVIYKHVWLRNQCAVKQKISKMGMNRIRTLLYVCAMQAKSYNVACAECLCD
jgi:transposase